jgi:hypothetical protein
VPVGNRLEQLIASVKTPPAKHDADGVVHEEPEPRAVRAADMPDDMKQALDETIQELEAAGKPAGEPLAGPDDDGGMVTLTMPGPAPRRTLVLTLAEAGQQLRALGRQTKKRKGATWCAAALELNPWLADLDPTLHEYLTWQRLECLKDEEKAAASTTGGDLLQEPAAPLET